MEGFPTIFFMCLWEIGFLAIEKGVKKNLEVG